MAFRRFQYKYHCYLVRNVLRNFSTEQAAAPELETSVRQDIESDRIKPRKHPGVLKIGTCSLPDNIVDAVRLIVEDHPTKNIVKDAKLLSQYLLSRHHPLEEEDYAERRSAFHEDVKSRIQELPDDASEDQVRHYNDFVKSRVNDMMSKFNYRWSALEMNEYSSLVYLFTRAAPNYAVILRVFKEISKQCPDYNPTTLFDFGSGLGTVSWAAKAYWGKSLQEYVNVDSSSSMNDLAELLLKGGRPTEPSPPGVHFRQFLPAQESNYSMVVSAHSLMELPSREKRLELLLNLWNKTEDFLVLVEQGTKPGFKVIVEARDFLLSVTTEKSSAHVFAPCPHDGPCPRFLKGPYPCHYQVSYIDLPVGRKQNIRKELFSYIIIRKGKRRDLIEWPRVVRPILPRHNHVICRLCTMHGDLREIIFTKNRHGKILYKCAKVTNWGDRLPVNLPPVSSEDPPQECQQEINEGQHKPD